MAKEENACPKSLFLRKYFAKDRDEIGLRAEGKPRMHQGPSLMREKQLPLKVWLCFVIVTRQNSQAVDDKVTSSFITDDTFLTVTIFKEFPNNHSSIKHVQHHSFIIAERRGLVKRKKNQVRTGTIKKPMSLSHEVSIHKYEK